MPRKQNLVRYPELKGAEQHHDLKNRPGEAGDKTHADDSDAPKGETKQVIKSSDADTQIADALRDTSKD